MNNFSKIIFIESKNKMKKLAEQLADFSQKGDIFLLDGEIGVGKSFFSRNFIKYLGYKQNSYIKEVPSPTFNLVQTYNQLKPPVWHFDLYRLSCVKEIYELGLEYAIENSICLIEWPGRLKDDLPKNSLNIFFKYKNFKTRRLEFILNLYWKNRLKYFF